MHISRFWPGVSDPPFPNANSHPQAQFCRLRSPGDHFRILARCHRSSISKYKRLFKSLVLKAEESRRTFQDFGQVSQILHFQISKALKAEDSRFTFQGFGQVSQISISKYELLFNSLASKAEESRVNISGIWPGVQNLSFPNTDSYSKA